VQAWEYLAIVGGSAALVARVATLWSGFPPPRHWRLRARVGVWAAFAVATACMSVFVYVLWTLSKEAAPQGS
jgi:hypothetical protein